MIQIPSWAAGLLVSVVSAIIGILAYSTGRRKDRDAEIQQRAVTNTKLDMLINKTETTEKSVNDAMARMESKYEGIACKLESHETRITRVEESTKSAHHRIDGIEKGGN